MQRRTLDADEVHVWHFLTEGQTPPGAMRDMLPADEIERLNRLRQERDRSLFLWSRGLMRTVLASYLDCPPGQVQFAADQFGKPVLLGADPPPVQFNLTHTRGAIALAVSRKREVGIDVEDRGRIVEYLALAERYFAPGEAGHLRGLPAHEVPDAFFAIWTLKEAFVKGIGRGLSFPLEAFCFELAGRRLVGFHPLADFVDRAWHFHQFELGQRHIGALAVQGEHAVIEMRDWAKAILG